MAEPVGLVFGVASLVLQIYTKCQNSSVDFRSLDQDLKLFHEALLLSEPYLPHLESVRIACTKLDAEIEALLVENKSRNPWKRVKLSFTDIQPLRARLHYMVSTLHLDVSMLRHRDLKPSQTATIQCKQSIQVRDAGPGCDIRTRNDISEHDIQDLSFDYTRPILLEHHSSSSSISDGFAHTPSTIASTASSASDGTARHRLSLQSSISNSSISTAATDFSARAPRSKTRGSCSGANTFQEEDATIPTAVRSQESLATVNEVLVNVCKMHKATPAHATQVMELLRRGASLEHKDSEHFGTPLIWAIVFGRTDLVELFLHNKASPDVCGGKWGWTAATWAVVEDQPAILECLICYGADMTVPDRKSGYTALLWAASTGNTRAARLILESDCALINAADKEGMTPLALAYFENHLDTAQVFVKHGDNPSFKDKYGSSLLAWAIRSKQVAFASLLIQHGADTQSNDMNGIAVLILAIKQDLPEVVELLVHNGADVRCRDASKVPALTLAVKNQQSHVVEILIDNQADLEARDGDGNTALMWAVWYNDEKMVGLLVKNNADADAMDGEGDSTVREWATRMGKEEIVQILSPIGKVRTGSQLLA